MESKIETKVLATYKGHGITPNKNINLSFACKYDQLVDYVQLIQFLNVDINIKAKLPDRKGMDLGTFRLKELKVEDDGDGVIKFNSMTDFVNADEINQLVGAELIKLKFTGLVEVEQEDEEEENEDDWKE